MLGWALRKVDRQWNRTEVWLRWTACFRKIDGNWLIAHDEVSVPVDPECGGALRKLKP